MGTLLAVTLAHDDLAAHGELLSAVFDTATACERVMSVHRADSALSRLNARAGDPGGIASPPLAHALRLARELAEVSGGAFDPTIGPVLDVWREASRRGVWPSPRRLAAACGAVGWRAIDVRGSRVALRHPAAAVDLGGFGKGLALDLIADRLRRQGCAAALLNFGESSLVALGRPRGGRWRIALRHPRGGFAGEFPLGRRACSTSATLGRPLRVGSRRVGHVIDPRTGRPVRGCRQVTVLSRSAAVAEAASTAMLVSGPSAFEELARRLRVDACWIDDAGIVATPWFPLRRLAATA
jgi:thiamine biosynthesis lipoprotein